MLNFEFNDKAYGRNHFPFRTRSFSIQRPTFDIQHCSGGFTLLELIMVMTLSSLILGLVTVFFAGTLPSARLAGTAREISAAVRQARVTALYSGEDKLLTLDLDTRFYGPEGGKMRAIPPDIRVAVEDPMVGRIGYGKYPIRFHASGGAEGGTIILWNAKKAIYLRIDPVVGAVRL